MGERPQSTINPTAFALQAAKSSVPVKKKAPVVVSSQAPMQSSLQPQPLQSQAPSTNVKAPVITPPTVTPKIGGISWPFGATNINAQPTIGGATAPELGKQQQIINSQPKTPATLPETGVGKVDINTIWSLGANVMKWEDLPTIRSKYPEFDSVNDEILGSVLSTMYNGAWPEEIMQKFPELVGNSVEASAQGWVKGEIARQGSSNSTIELANPVGTVFEGIDNLARKIPTVNKEDVKAFIEKYNLPFDPEVFPTMFLNIPWSTIKTTTASARGLTNPLDNFIGLYKLVMTPEGRQALGDRYGSIGAFEKSMTEDPTGVASDILSVIQLGTKGASAVNKGLGNAETAAKLSNISNTAGGAANMGMDIIPWALDNLANQWGAKGVVGKVLNAPLRPIKTAGDIVKGAVGLVPEGAKNYVAKKLISNKLKITDTNKRAIQKASWVESNEFMLENDLIGDNVDVVIDKTQDMIDSSMKQKLETFESIKEPQKVGTREKLMTQSVIDQAKNDMSELYQKPYDQIKSDEILPELQSQFNIIDNLEKLSKSATTEAIKLQALQSLYDIYNNHLKYDPTKKRILRAQETIRLGMQKQLEDLGAEMWVDIKDLNKKIAGGMALKKWLDQAWNRMDNNNMFWLSDTQTAILGAALGGWPIGVTAWLLGKSVLENMWVRSKMAKSLYTKQPVNGWSNGSSNTAISRATASSNISNQFGGSDTAVNSSKSNIKVKPVTNTNKVPVKASEEVLSKPKTKVPVKESNPLLAEAKKYKSAEDFVEWISENLAKKDIMTFDEFQKTKPSTTLEMYNKIKKEMPFMLEKEWEFIKWVNQAQLDKMVNPWSNWRHSQLKQIREEANGKTKVPVKESNPLLAEAKKYKSADDMIKSMEDKWEIVYHGTNNKFDKFDAGKISSATDDGLYGRGFYFTPSKEYAKNAPRGWAKEIMKVHVKADNLLDIRKYKDIQKLADMLDMSESALLQDSNWTIRPIQSQINQFTTKVQDLWYDWIKVINNGKIWEMVIFDPKNVKTESQLKQIREEANGKPIPKSKK